MMFRRDLIEVDLENSESQHLKTPCKLYVVATGDLREEDKQGVCQGLKARKDESFFSQTLIMFCRV